MIKLVIFGLIVLTLIMVSIFIGGLLDLHKQEMEEKKNWVRAGMEGYLDQTFGYGNVKVFKSMVDANGNECYLVYLPQLKWFKTPKYKWYEVYATQSGFEHYEVKRSC